MKIKGIDFVLYPVSDYKRSVAFYRDILGLILTHEYKDYWCEFDTGAGTFVITSHEIVSKGATVAFAVDDLKKAVEYLKAKKVNVTEEPRETGVCFMATVLDPDGNEIILHQRKDATVG